MKKLLTIPLFTAIFFIACLVLDSCSLDESIGNEQSETYVPEALLDEAKSWHQAETKQPGLFSIKKVKKSALQPDWSNAKAKRINGVVKEILTPVNEYKMPDSKMALERLIVFSVNDNRVDNGKIIEVFSTRHMAKRYQGNQPSDYKEIDDFTGGVITYTVNYKYLYSEVYVEGKKTHGATAKIQRIKIAKENKTIARLKETKCYNYYYVSCTQDGVCDYEFLKWDCEGSIDGPSGENPGGDPDGENPGGGGGTGGGPTSGVITVAPATVITNLQTPCLQSVYNEVTSSNLANDVAFMLEVVFGFDNKINVTFGEDPSMPNDVIAETYAVKKDPVNNLYDIEVNLNPNVLQNASKEFIADTYYHEIIHAVLDVNKFSWDETQQHVYMAANHVKLMVDALQEVYPHLSKSEAARITIGGFGELQQSNPQKFDELCKAFNVTTAEVIQTSGAHKAGTQGTKCASH
jgi:hypothetical protein